ncbi:MAG: ATP-binding cassette domain-containing protein [Oscillospiraceae bacterium]
MLRIKNLTKRYAAKEDVYALNGVSLELGNGLHALLGPNGSGKSTLMKIVTQGLEPTSGVVLWDNKLIEKMGNSFFDILGYMPQQQGMYDGFTGRELLEYFCALKSVPDNRINSEIERTADIVNLSDELNKKIAAYSGGMKQRLLAAQALLGDPKLLIFDEPTAGLDPKERVRLREALAATAKENKIVIIATHVVSDVETVADNIIFLRRGNVVDSGSPQELLSRYKHCNGLEEVYMQLYEEEEKL